MTQKVLAKSILLNKQSRQDIVDNIMQSYKKQNPPPKVKDTRKQELHAALLTYYHEKYADMINFYKNSSMARDFMQADYYALYQDSSKNTCTLNFKSKEGDSETLPIKGYSMFVNLSNPDNVATLPKYVTDVIDSNKRKEKSIRKQRAALSAWEVEYERYEQDITNVIAGSRSTGQLLNVWPEVERFLPVGANDPSVITLPSVNINNLNTRLGIKK